MSDACIYALLLIVTVVLVVVWMDAGFKRYAKMLQEMNEEDEKEHQANLDKIKAETEEVRKRTEAHDIKTFGRKI